jgi:hypothetical protein
LKELSLNYISIRNSELQNSKFQLEDYDFVFWILGDESTVDETFNLVEQSLVKSYLENGGNLFLSGSEIGWDLDYKGSSADKAFYNNYLKANYVSDDASSNSVAGIANRALDGCSIIISQIYEEDYPDEIETQNGSSLCMKYSNGKGAGIEYSGNFGNSNTNSNLIYLAFPLETTANDESFNQIISNSVNYFNANPTSVSDNSEIVNSFKLEQNYPNPFNPSTTIKYSIPVVDVRQLTDAPTVQLKVYDILGCEVATLVNERQAPGNYEVKFNPSSDGLNLSSGIYFYKLNAGNIILTKKLMLLK